MGGQFELRRRRGNDCLHLRGEISILEVICEPPTVNLTFSWLYKALPKHDWKLDVTLKWCPLERPFKNEMNGFTLILPWDSFRLHPDEGRIKMWGGGFGDICRFYQPFDHTNLVWNGDELVTRFEKHRAMFLHILALHTE